MKRYLIATVIGLIPDLLIFSDPVGRFFVGFTIIVPLSVFLFRLLPIRSTYLIVTGYAFLFVADMFLGFWLLNLREEFISDMWR
ncbi:MAG: hypothetical protein H7831_13890 [Magnetococcus sp. WYHC-3]